MKPASVRPKGRMQSRRGKLPPGVHTEIRTALETWGQKALTMLDASVRDRAVLNLHLARSRVEMHRVRRTFEQRYRKTLRDCLRRLDKLIAETPAFASSFPAMLKHEGLLGTLAWLADEGMATPPPNRWRKEKPPMYRKVGVRRRGKATEVLTADSPMPLAQLEALEAQRHGKYLYDQLREAGVPAREATSLTCQGLRVARLLVDSAIDFEWRGDKFDPETHEVLDEPHWLFDVAKGGAPERYDADGIQAEQRWWESFLRKAQAEARSRNWTEFQKNLLTRTSAAVAKRRGSPLSPKETTGIRSALSKVEAGSLTIAAKQLTKFSKGVSSRTVDRKTKPKSRNR